MLMLPILLFCILTVPVEVAYTPCMDGVLADGVIVIAPLPVSAPIVFAVVVPTFTVPARILMPEKIPAPDAVWADVENKMAVMVFPWISDVLVDPAVSSMGTRLALPVNVLVPVPKAELYPIILLLIAYPTPLAVTMLMARYVPLIDLEAVWKNRLSVIVQVELLLATYIPLADAPE